MQLRVEEHKDYETTIKNDPIELLKVIQVLMHDPARAKYPLFASMTEALLQVLTFTKQQDNKNLIDYVRPKAQNTKSILAPRFSRQNLSVFRSKGLICDDGMMLLIVSRLSPIITSSLPVLNDCCSVGRT